MLLVTGLGVLVSLCAAHPSGWVPACPTRAHLGFVCPGCGSMRAIHHLLNMDLATAFNHNPLMLILGVPLGLVLVLFLGFTTITGRRLVLVPTSSRLAWSALGVLLLYTVLRNTPWWGVGEALSPPEMPNQIRSISTSPGMDRRNDLP